MNPEISKKVQIARRTFYRIQGILGMTERECRMFLMLAILVLTGSIARHYQTNRSDDNPEAFAKFDAEFRRQTARADSLDVLREAKIEQSLDRERGIDAPDTDIPVASRLDLNRASSEELQKLPGIGPSIAGKILAIRSRLGRFLTVEDLLLVSGIGEKTLQRLRPHLTVRAPENQAAR